MPSKLGVRHHITSDLWAEGLEPPLRASLEPARLGSDLDADEAIRDSTLPLDYRPHDPRLSAGPRVNRHGRCSGSRHGAVKLMYTSDEVMYDERVKRLQIMIEEELDEALAVRARREGTSKAALLRRFARQELEPLTSIKDDPLWEMVGADPDIEPGEIDEVVYGGKTRNRP